MISIYTLSGLILPPAIWAVMMQLGLILPHADCRGHSSWTFAAAALAALLALAASGLSRHAAVSRGTRYSLFLGNLSFLIGLAFTFALFLQGAASALIDPCLR